MIRRSRIAWRDDAGFAGGVEVLPFGVLIFVVGSLLVANAWAVVDAKMAVTAASREAARAYVESTDAASAMDRARAVMVEAMDGHGRDGDKTHLLVVHEGDAPYARCVQVTIEVRHTVPAISLPWIGGYGHGFDVVSTHTERIDPFRDGLVGDGRC